MPEFHALMAAPLRLLLLLVIFSDSLCTISSLRVGINYGLRTNVSLPPPTRVSSALRSLNITRVKIFYNEDPSVLSAFANTPIELIIELGNEYIPRMTNPNEARKWISQHIEPCIPQTKIRGITIGKDVLDIYDSNLTSSHLLQAMKTVNRALTSLGLNKEIFVTTVHSSDIIFFHASTVVFRRDVIEDIQNILKFQEQTHSPFLIKAYPYGAYAYGEVSWEYAILQPNPGMIDPTTNLHYDNYLYRQIDRVYLAIESLGYTNIRVIVSETAWPPKWDSNKQATPENAGLFVGNLFNRMQMNEGTPRRPDLPLEVFLSSLFYENLAEPFRTPDMEFALYHSNGVPAYKLGLRGYLPRMDMDSS